MTEVYHAGSAVSKKSSFSYRGHTSGLTKKMAARRQHFSRKEVIEQKAAVVAAAVKLRLQVCRSLSSYPQK